MVAEREGENAPDRRLVRGIETEVGRHLQGYEEGAVDAGAMIMMILEDDLFHGIILLRHRHVGLVVMTYAMITPRTTRISAGIIQLLPVGGVWRTFSYTSPGAEKMPTSLSVNDIGLTSSVVGAAGSFMGRVLRVWGSGEAGKRYET